jgi:hypothetical protein
MSATQIEPHLGCGAEGLKCRLQKLEVDLCVLTCDPAGVICPSLRDRRDQLTIHRLPKSVLWRLPPYRSQQKRPRGSTRGFYPGRFASVLSVRNSSV